MWGKHHRLRDFSVYIGITDSVVRERIATRVTMFIIRICLTNNQHHRDVHLFWKWLGNRLSELVCSCSKCTVRCQSTLAFPLVTYWWRCWVCTVWTWNCRHHHLCEHTQVTQKSCCMQGLPSKFHLLPSLSSRMSTTLAGADTGGRNSPLLLHHGLSVSLASCHLSTLMHSKTLKIGWTTFNESPPSTIGMTIGRSGMSTLLSRARCLKTMHLWAWKNFGDSFTTTIPALKGKSAMSKSLHQWTRDHTRVSLCLS